MQQLKKSPPRGDLELSARELAAKSRANGDRHVADGSTSALFLDIDGTLLDVALTPSTVHVPPNLSQLLDAISARLSGALAIVTGRQIQEADRLLQPSKFVAAGVHGGQMRFSADGSIATLTPRFDSP